MLKSRNLNPNIKYCLRVRPYMNEEGMIKVDDSKRMTISDVNKNDENASQKFDFDNIFPETASQNDVFDYMKDNCIGHLI